MVYAQEGVHSTRPRVSGGGGDHGDAPKWQWIGGHLDDIREDRDRTLLVKKYKYSVRQSVGVVQDKPKPRFPFLYCAGTLSTPRLGANLDSYPA